MVRMIALFSMLAVLAAVAVGCQSTTPNAVTGQPEPVRFEKGYR